MNLSSGSTSFVVGGHSASPNNDKKVGITAAPGTVPIVLRKPTNHVPDSCLIFEIPSTKKNPPDSTVDSNHKGKIQASTSTTAAPATAIPSDTNNLRTISINNGSGNMPSVDSALLSALRDPRERVALLRLEQTLVDFMNDNRCAYMDVGGPYNSVFIKGGGEGGDSTITSHRVIEGGRQTSFQRLCVHRLADRFNIAREVASSPLTSDPTNNNINNGKNLALSGAYSPGLIRLIKTKTSCIPTFLLIDTDFSNYDNNNSININNNNNSHDNLQLTDNNLSNGVSYHQTNNNNSKGISDRLSGMNLMTKESNKSSNNTKNGKKKIKIMKRSSSGNSNNSSDSPNNNSSSSNNKLKGKNLSDREKAYAEARARIFNTTQKTSSNSSLQEVGEENADIQSNTNSNTSEFTPSNQNNSSIIDNSNVLTDNNPSIQDISCVNPGPENDAASSHSSGSNGLPVQVSSFNKGTSNTNNDFNNTSNHSNNNNSNYRAATSKVTWRNRKQEESDPDFRRSRLPVVIPMPTNAVPTMAATGAYSAAQHGGIVMSPHLLSGMGIVPSHHTMTQHAYAPQPAAVDNSTNTGYNPIHAQQQIPIHSNRYMAQPLNSKGVSVTAPSWSWPQEQNDSLNYTYNAHSSTTSAHYKNESKSEPKSKTTTTAGQVQPPSNHNNTAESRAPPSMAQDQQPKVPNHVSILPAPQASSSSKSDATIAKKKSLSIQNNANSSIIRNNGCPWGQQPTNTKTPTIFSDFQIKSKKQGSLIYNAEEFPSLE